MKQVQIINLTPHAINFIGAENTPILTIEPFGELARVSCQTIVTGEVAGIPVTTTSYSEVTGLPEPQDNVIYVVSSLVAQRCPNRKDVFIPNESVRDENGRIIGCKSLGRV